MKCLVAYFSCNGETQRLAKYIADKIAGDLFPILPELPYSEADLNYRDPASRATVETKTHTARPAFSPKPESIAEYDTVFIGFPVWWYTTPVIINSFLEAYDFSGKTVIPFCTSGSSGSGSALKDMKASCGEKTIFKAVKRFPRGWKEADAEKWLSDLGI